MATILTSDELAILRPTAEQMQAVREELSRVGEHLAVIDQALTVEQGRLAEAQAKLKVPPTARVDRIAQLKALLSGGKTASVDVDEALQVKDHNQRVGIEIEAIKVNIDLLTAERQQEAERVAAETSRLNTRLNELREAIIFMVAETLEQRAKAEILAMANGSVNLLKQLVRQESRDAPRGWKGFDWTDTLQCCWPDPSSPRKVHGHGYLYPFEKKEDVPDLVGKVMAEIETFILTPSPDRR